MLRLVMVGFALLLSVAGCAGSAPEGSAELEQSAVSAPADVPQEFPVPSELVRSASSFQKLLGSQVYQMRNAWVIDHTLFLQAPILPDPGEGSKDIKDESPPRTTSAGSNKFAYGLFVFGGIDKGLATLDITTGYNTESRFWVALANWDRNAWDFSQGSFLNNPTLDISDPEQFDPFIDEEGRIAVALIAVDPAEQIKIYSLELTLLSDVTKLEANNFRWDGVELEWEAPSSTDGFRVVRRLADDTSGPWTPTHVEPLGRYDRSFVDTQSLPGVEYTYLVQSGFLRQPGGLPRWYWSPGAMVNGRRQVSEVEVDASETSRHLPFLVGNRLGFFSQRSLDPSRLDGIRNRTYTPGVDWDLIGSGDSSFTSFALTNVSGFDLPLLSHQSEQVNNPVCSLVYSTLDGTFTQVCDRQPDDSLLWQTPVKVRDADTVVLALVNMPRRIGAVVYNRTNSMLELVDSVDINGRIWYDFEPQTYPWMTIGAYRPDGRVSVDRHGVDPQLCFRDSNSGDLTYLVFDYSGWIDSSPDGVPCAPGPILASASAPLGLPEVRVFHISPDRSELRVIPRDIYGDWQPQETEVLVTAEPGSELSEIALFTSGKVSYETYLVYNIDGKLYAQRSMSSSLTSWTPVVTLDDSGSCRDLQIIKVGSNEYWESHHYASYIKDGPEGEKLIAFRDLYEATTAYE